MRTMYLCPFFAKNGACSLNNPIEDIFTSDGPYFIPERTCYLGPVVDKKTKISICKIDVDTTNQCLDVSLRELTKELEFRQY